MKQSLFRGWKYSARPMKAMPGEAKSLGAIPPGARRLRAKSGFTLIEVLVTIGILSILTAISISTVAGNLPLWRAKGAMNEVITLTQKARAISVKKNKWVLVNFTGINSPGASVVTLYLDTNNNGVVDVGTDERLANLVVEGNFPGAYFSSVKSGVAQDGTGGAAMTTMALAPDGTVKPNTLTMPIEVVVASSHPSVTTTYRIRVERSGLARIM